MQFNNRILSSPIKNISHLFKLHGLHEPQLGAYDVSSMIRVNLAGEMGANKIYDGQLVFLGKTLVSEKIKEMKKQEQFHEETFKQLIAIYRVRPSLLAPLWNTAGYYLGAATAALGVESAMACTSSVETVIVEHYNEQLRTLINSPERNNELMEIITKFRDDEQEHHDTGVTFGAEQAPFYKLLKTTIETGCKCAIEIAKII